MSIPPLVISFDVRVPPTQAFEVWTGRCESWWPPSHTISGNPARIIFEPRPGGGIVEQGTDGRRHRWGEILDWDPPTRLRYLWHLFFDPSEATEVEVTFTPAAGGTTVRLEQRGWDRLAELAARRRDRNQQAWRTITARYVEACSS